MGSSFYLRMSCIITLLLNAPDLLELMELHLGMGEEETLTHFSWVTLISVGGTAYQGYFMVYLMVTFKKKKVIFSRL